jgi:hypothetical protein
LAISSVEPPLSPSDKRALQRFVDKINKVPGFFTGTRFVFKDSVIRLTEETKRG